MSAFSRLAPWTYGFIAAIVILIIMMIANGVGSLGSVLSAALIFAAISVVVASGQMFVIATGPGNIDLSVPAVLTLSAYTAMTAAAASGGLALVGLAAALGTGMVAGALNYGAILALRLPPIIATLAWSFVFQSVAFNFGGEATLKPPAALAAFTSTRFAGIQIMPICIMGLTALAALILTRGIWGRRVLAVGQSEAAAHFAGINVKRVRLISYVICGGAAGLAGYLLAGFTGGAALNMGDTYLMEAIAIVALGGTSIAGGQANAIGIWGAAMFFNLMGTMLNTFQFQAGMRFIIMGVLIIAIVAIVPKPKVR
ncbi:ABC transporter permease [Celeribacter sp. ULVN23_4]